LALLCSCGGLDHGEMSAFMSTANTSQPTWVLPPLRTLGMHLHLVGQPLVLRYVQYFKNFLFLIEYFTQKPSLLRGTEIYSPP
jgi:hypothetical protein